MKMESDKEIPSFIYTSAHSRDLEAIKAMAAEIETRVIDFRTPDYLKREGWEELDEAIDEDIDEGEYVSEDLSLIDVKKKKMIRIRYKKQGTLMERQKKPLEM